MSFLAFERKRIWWFVIKDVPFSWRERVGWMHETQLLTRFSKEGGGKKPRGKITIIYTIKRNRTRRNKEEVLRETIAEFFLNTMYLSKGQKRKKKKKKNPRTPHNSFVKAPLGKKKGLGTDTEFCSVFHHSFIHIHYVVPTIKKKSYISIISLTGNGGI